MISKGFCLERLSGLTELLLARLLQPEDCDQIFTHFVSLLEREQVGRKTE